MWRPRSSADSSTCRSVTRSSELAREDDHPQCIRGGRPISRSDRERNPDPEEVEAPLVVTGIPHRLVHPTVAAAVRPSPRAADHYPKGHRGIDRASRCPRGSMVVASRGCRVRGSHRGADRRVRRVRRVRGSHPGADRRVRRVRGSHPGADRPVRRVRRVRGSHPVEDRPARPVAVARRGRAAAVARPDRLGRIEPVETACTEVRRRQCLTPN